MYSSSISTPATADHDGATSITAIHNDIIQSHILNRVDGATLASTSCASTQFLSLCSVDDLWRNICNSTWPSTTHPLVRDAISAFPSGHRSFYSDSFPSPHCHNFNKLYQWRVPETSELISAVDIHYDDVLIYSKVIVTETLSDWFLCSPFRLDLLKPKEKVSLPPLKFDAWGGTAMQLAEEHLRVSWILIDPARKRAVNVASVKAVEARMHWMTEEIELRHATAVAGGGGEPVQFGVVISLAGKAGGESQVREVGMQVEDMEGRIVTGEESLRILQEVMEGKRSRRDGKMEREVYERFLEMTMECREIKLRRERGWDMVSAATVISVFLAVWIFFMLR